MPKNDAVRSRATFALWIAAAVGLAMFATVTMTDRHLPHDSSWWLRAGVDVPVVLLVVALLLTLAAWALLARVPALVDRPYLLMGGFGAVLLLMPPLFSNDLYAYVGAGWMQSQHLDPYTTPVGSLAASPVWDYVQSWWGSYTPYGPGGLGLFHLVGAATGYQMVTFIVAFRALCIASICLMVPCVRSIARVYGVSPRYAVWAGPLNPLMLIHGIGGAHIDVPAILLVLVGVRLALVPRLRAQVAAMVTIGVAASIRQSAAVLGLFVCVTAWRLLADRLPQLGARARGVVVVAGGALIGAATIQLTASAFGLGWGWVHNLSTPGSSIISPIGFVTELTHGTVPSAPVVLAGVVIGVVVAGWLAARVLRVNTLFAVAVFFLSFQAISMASYHTWYYLLPVALLACAARGPVVRWIPPAVVVCGTQLDIWGDQGFPSQLRALLGSGAAAAIGVLAMTAITTVALLAIGRLIVPETGDISFVEPRVSPRQKPVLAQR